MLVVKREVCLSFSQSQVKIVVGEKACTMRLLRTSPPW